VNKPLDELYLNWLYAQIDDIEETNKSHTHWNLANLLYKKEFIWFIPNDDNRVEDGRYLRHEFIEDLGLVDVDPDWMALGCSVLEMLIGLSRRMSFLADGNPRDWFWHLIDNLALRYNDRRKIPEAFVDDVLTTLICRTYKRTGHGGLFPLRRARHDQREVEIWSQLSAYLTERA
jgi:hypothetical protein